MTPISSRVFRFSRLASFSLPMASREHANRPGPGQQAGLTCMGLRAGSLALFNLGRLFWGPLICLPQKLNGGIGGRPPWPFSVCQRIWA